MEKLNKMDSYIIAQKAITELKSAIFLLLKNAPGDGLKNSEIGKALGIYHGHNNQHEGHISRSLLDMMEGEGIIEQDQTTKKWKLKKLY